MRHHSPRSTAAVPLHRRLADLKEPGYSHRPPLDWVREILEEYEDPVPEMAELAVSSPDETVRECALMAFALVAFEPSVPRGVRARFSSEAVRVWREALRQERVPARSRELLVPLLSLFAGGLEPEEIAAIPEKTGDRFRSSLRSMAEEGIEGVELALRALCFIEDPFLRLPRGDAPEVMQGVRAAVDALEDAPGETVTVACIGVAAAVEAGVDPALLEEPLDRIAATGHPEASWLLAELGRWPSGGEAFERAARLGADLRARGVRPAMPDLGRFSRARATAVDGAGSRSVGVTFETGQGASRMLMLLLNEDRGILDSFLLGEEVPEESVAGYFSELPQAPIGLEFTRSLVGDALLRHRSSGRPVPAVFLLHRPVLGPDPLLEKPHVPDPRIPSADPEAGRRPDGSGTGALADYGLFGQFWFASPEVYEFVRRRRESGGLSALRRLRIDGRLLDAFHREVLPGEREGLLRHLDAALEIYALGGDAREAGRGDRTILLARRVHRALADGGVPMEGIPYVRRLVRRSLEVVDQNLRDGHQSQAEANQAGLDAEDGNRRELEEIAREIAWSLPDPLEKVAVQQ